MSTKIKSAFVEFLLQQIQLVSPQTTVSIVVELHTPLHALQGRVLAPILLQSPQQPLLLLLHLPHPPLQQTHIVLVLLLLTPMLGLYRIDVLDEHCSLCLSHLQLFPECCQLLLGSEYLLSVVVFEGEDGLL